MFSAAERLPAAVLQLLFERCSPGDLLAVFPQVCHRWDAHIRQNLETITTRDLLEFPNGGSEEELLSVLAFLRRGNQNSRLQSIMLRELLPLSWRCIDYFIGHLKSPFFGCLTSLLVNSPYYPAVSDLETLTSLTVEIYFSEYKTDTERPFSLGGVWCLPRNGSLTSLTIKGEDCCYSGSLRYRSDLMPSVVLGELALGGNTLVRNLKRLSFKGDFESFMSVQLGFFCPELEHLELSGEDERGTLSELTLPKTLKTFHCFVNHCRFRLPIDFSALSNITDLTLLNTRTWSFDYRWGQSTPFWSLSPLLKMPQLTSLRILSTDAFNENQEQYETFCTQLATMPNDSPDKPQLTLLDVTSLFLSRDTVDLLKKAFPEAEVLYRLRHIETVPEEEAPLLTQYLAPVQLGPLIACPQCNMQVEEQSPQDHALVCANAIRSCRLCAFGCPFTGTTLQVRQHIPHCVFNVMSCSYCLESVHFQRYHDHSQSHLSALAHVQADFLRQPYAKTPEYEVITCHSCKNDFKSLNEAQNHGCTKIGAGFLLPQKS